MGIGFGLSAEQNSKSKGNEMDSTKYFKTQAASAKRAATSISTLITEILSQSRIDPTQALSTSDAEHLTAAMRILRGLGAKATTSAKKAAEKAAAQEKAIEKATAQAKQIIALWPQTSLDKIALIIIDGMYFRNDIADELTKDEANSHLQSWFESALREIPRHAAYRAVINGKQIEDVMDVEKAKIAEIKARPDVMALAEKLDVQAGMYDFDRVKTTVDSTGKSYGW